VMLSARKEGGNAGSMLGRNESGGGGKYRSKEGKRFQGIGISRESENRWGGRQLRVEGKGSRGKGGVKGRRLARTGKEKRGLSSNPLGREGGIRGERPRGDKTGVRQNQMSEKRALRSVKVVKS